MTDLDALRPEVKAAMRCVTAPFDPFTADSPLSTPGSKLHNARIVAAELLRLAGIESELAALKARIAESAHVEVTLGCAIDGEIPPDLALCKVALVKMENDDV